MEYLAYLKDSTSENVTIKYGVYILEKVEDKEFNLEKISEKEYLLLKIKY